MQALKTSTRLRKVYRNHVVSAIFTARALFYTLLNE